MFLTVIFGLGLSHASDSSIGRHIQFQNAQAHSSYFFFLSPPESVSKNSVGFPRFSGESGLKLAEDYNGDVKVFAYPKKMLTTDSVFKKQDTWMDLNAQVQTLRKAEKNTTLSVDSQHENARQLRLLETEKESIRLQLEDQINKGVPKGAIPCDYPFAQGFLQGGTSVNVTERLSIKSLTGEKCELASPKRKPPLPKTPLSTLDSTGSDTTEIGCGCSTASSSSLLSLLPFLGLVLVRRKRGYT